MQYRSLKQGIYAAQAGRTGFPTVLAGESRPGTGAGSSFLSSGSASRSFRPWAAGAASRHPAPQRMRRSRCSTATTDISGSARRRSSFGLWPCKPDPTSFTVRTAAMGRR